VISSAVSIQVKLTKVTRQLEEDKRQGTYSEERERELMQQLTADMQPLMVDTLW